MVVMVSKEVNGCAARRGAAARRGGHAAAPRPVAVLAFVDFLDGVLAILTEERALRSREEERRRQRGEGGVNGESKK